MRFRSLTIYAKNKLEYLKKVNETENNYFNNISLSSLDLISLDENDLDNDDYVLLSSNSNYKIMRYDNDKHKKRRRRRKFSFQFPLFRKKINKRKRGSTSFITSNNQNESN
jgi:hypothetical protein